MQNDFVDVWISGSGDSITGFFRKGNHQKSVMVVGLFWELSTIVQSYPQLDELVPSGREKLSTDHWTFPQRAYYI
jgi:hypothetical protein